MKHKKLWTCLILSICLFVIILDAKTALTGASDGIRLCLFTVIPSLFPFFILSTMLNNELLGSSIIFIKPVARFCGVPKGAESLLLLGLVGGYPVGAQCIYNAYNLGAITHRQGQRMLGFCNNAGPAFIFGLGTCLFRSPIYTWSTWGIQTISAILIGALLPGKAYSSTKIKHYDSISLPHALKNSIHITANVCGWIVTFRIVICFLSRWILWLLPQHLQVLTSGIIELSNGAVNLLNIPGTGLRFVLFNIMLSSGGFCVAMQTRSATDKLGMGLYFPGKVLQMCVAFLLSSVIQFLICPAGEQTSISPIAIAFSISVFTYTLFLLHKIKKRVAITKKMLYNR